MNILIQNCTYWTGNNDFLEGSIGITDDKIAWMGQDTPADWEADQVINGKDKLAIPGFINTHNHAAMVLLRSYADDLVLQDWLEKEIWPAEANLIGNDIYWGTQLSIMEMIRSGTTTFADMYFFMDEVAQAVEETGIRASLCRGITSFGNEGNAKLKESEEFFKSWNGKADGRIEVWHGPHAPYTCSPDFLEKVIASSKELGMKIHIHLAETKKEVVDCINQYGKTPIELMDSIGMFNVHTLGAHCVHLTPNDIDIIANKNVKVAHNPGSNLKLASGIAPVPELLGKRVKVALGTDGAASNNNQDMLEEVRFAALLHKNHTGDPTVIPAYQALQMATIHGADALGLPYTGNLEVGKKADITLFSMTEPHWFPKHNLISTLVYSAQSSDVSDVIVNGKILYLNREYLTIDEEKVIFEASRAAKELIEKRQKN